MGVAFWNTAVSLDSIREKVYNCNIFPLWFLSIGGDFLKRVWAVLLLCLTVSCLLGGCFYEADVPVDKVPDVTEASDSMTEEPAPPAIDYGAVIGRTEYDLITHDPESQKHLIPSAQTNLGDLCADAYRAVSGADVAIVCAGEIGDGIPCGEITVADIFATLPVECNLITVHATGEEILYCLEAAYQYLPRENSEFLHVSGVSAVLDMNQNPTVMTDDMGGVAGISGDGRVRDVLIGGAPLQADTTYTVTFSESFSYTVTSILGDNDRATETTVTNRDAWTAYVSDTLSGMVGDTYKNPFGERRIRAIPQGQTEVPPSDSLLPQVYITTENDLKRSTYVSCVITVHDPRGVYDDVYDTESTIKIRGHSTSAGAKTPYNIKFDSKVELLGLGKGKKWNLLANLYDKTQLRNALAYDFARETGMEYTSNSCFAELYFNGEYRGLYQICEPVDVSPTQVDIDTENNEYLMELEPYAGYSNPNILTTPVLKIILGYNEPDPPTQEQRAWLRNFMGEAENALLSGDYDAVKEYVDVESFARCYIVEELFKNVDYAVSSTRFYVKDNKLHEGPVWDFDLSSGNCSSTYYQAYNNVGGSGLSYEGLYCVGLFNQHLFRYEEFTQLVSDLYRELQPVIVNLYEDNELGPNKIDSLLEECRSEIDRNYTLWSLKKGYGSYEHKPVDGTYDGEIAYLKNWLKMRNLWLYDRYCRSAS